MLERYRWQSSVKQIFSHVFIPDDLKLLNVSFLYNICRHVSFVPWYMILYLMYDALLFIGIIFWMIPGSATYLLFIPCCLWMHQTLTIKNVPIVETVVSWFSGTHQQCHRKVTNFEIWVEGIKLLFNPRQMSLLQFIVLIVNSKMSLGPTNLEHCCLSVHFNIFS